MIAMRPSLLLPLVAAASLLAAAVAAPLKVWVVNVSTAEVPTSLVSFYQTAQGVINRVSTTDRVLLVGLTADRLKISGQDAAALSLAFLRAEPRYRPLLSFDDARYIAAARALTLFEQPFAKAALTHVVELGSDDADQALYAALTVAAQHGRAAVLRASPSTRREILARTGLTQLLPSLVGQVTATNSSIACAQANKFVRKQLRRDASNVSTAMFATWGRSVAGKPTKGFDFVIYKRLLTFCMDAQGSDANTTQLDILSHFPRVTKAGRAMPFGFGWWTKEGKDIVHLSSLGFSWLGGGHNLALYSQLPPLSGAPQPQAPLPTPAELPPHVAIVVFSFSQGDAESFGQKVRTMLLLVMLLAMLLAMLLLLPLLLLVLMSLLLCSFK